MRKELEFIADYYKPNTTRCHCGGEGCESCGAADMWEITCNDVQELVTEIRILEGLLEERT